MIFLLIKLESVIFAGWRPQLFFDRLVVAPPVALTELVWLCLEVRLLICFLAQFEDVLLKLDRHLVHAVGLVDVNGFIEHSLAFNAAVHEF